MVSSGSFGTEQQTIAAPRVKPHSSRFVIKSPAFSDVRKAHEAADRQALSERQIVAGGCLWEWVPQSGPLPNLNCFQ